MISGGKWAPLKLIAIVALPLFVLDHLGGRSYPKCVPNENLRQNHVVSVWQILHRTPSAPPISAQRVTRFDDHCTRNCLLHNKLRQRYSRSNTNGYRGPACVYAIITLGESPGRVSHRTFGGRWGCRHAPESHGAAACHAARAPTPPAGRGARLQAFVAPV